LIGWRRSSLRVHRLGPFIAARSSAGAVYRCAFIGEAVHRLVPFIGWRRSSLRVHRRGRSSLRVHRCVFIASRLPRGIAKRVFHGVHRRGRSSLRVHRCAFIAARLPRGIAKRVFHGVHRLGPFIG
jgi:hypothetical protein